MRTERIDQLLGELRTVATLASGKPAPQQVVKDAAEPVDFAAVLQASLDKVAERQAGSQNLQQRWELGDENVNLHDVMLSLQKASLSFQTMVQVRNKLVSAYQDIMNTQV